MNTNTNNTNIPNTLIEYIINDIHDETNIKCILRMIYLISSQPESTPWITYQDFLKDKFISNTTKNQKTMSALQSIIQKGLILSQVILIKNSPTRIFALNCTSTKEILTKYFMI